MKANLAITAACLALELSPPLWGAPASTAAMSSSMEMDDAAAVGKIILDQLELEGGSGGTATAWDAQAWYGGDYDKVWFKSEGTPEPDDKDSTRNELLWDHVLTRWWDLQAGVRYDAGQGPARGWAAVGLQGVAPYWFNVEATLYAGEAGRTAARLRIEHDLLITQRWILQPELQTSLYGKADAARDIGSGLSEMELGLRIRYEIRREVAPYVGLMWRREIGDTARLYRLQDLDPAYLQWVAGVRIWF